jgi:L-ascorbate metabolism protein UlaG (beta-lactamase superfamily)
MVIFLVILVFVAATVYLFIQLPQFGSIASGERLKKIQQSPHYRNSQFQNLSETPSLTEGASYSGIMKEFFFSKKPRNKPIDPIPSVKTDLLHLNPDDDILVWFGHSSYFMQIDGRKFLVDPVFSGNASPIPSTTKSFQGTDLYTAADIPDIDYLFISHDHYDHLDHRTIVQLKPKISKVITGLGVGAHLERWGYEKKRIIEKDWNEKLVLEEGFVVHTTPARHFSGRGFKRNVSLWLSFVLTTPTKKIFIGGDSGYDTHFTDIGHKHGPFDLVILENGQYNKNWKYIHMMPEEVVQAAEDLKASKLLPVHWSKFSLSLHSWDEPMIRVYKEAKRKGMPIVHPMIGEAVYLRGDHPSTTWWEGVK